MADDDKPFSWGLGDDEPAGEPDGEETQPSFVLGPPTEPVDTPTELITPGPNSGDTPTQLFTPDTSQRETPTELFTPPTESSDLPTRRMRRRQADAADDTGAGQPPDASGGADDPTSLFAALGIQASVHDELLATRSLATNPRRQEPEAARRARRTTDAEADRTTAILTWVAAGLLAVILLIGLFVLGTRLPAMFAAPVATPTPATSAKPSPTPSPTPTSTPTPISTPTPTLTPQKPKGTQPPGTYAWDELGGGECLEPYTSPWAEKFAVVDCTKAHSAQLVYSGTLPESASAQYPGADKLGSEATKLCTAGGIINLDAASRYADIQVQPSYPATAETWKSGARSYSCFASRSSGKPMTISIAGSGPGK